MRSRFTSLRSRSATASTAFTHISASSRLCRPTLQQHKESATALGRPAGAAQPMARLPAHQLKPASCDQARHRRTGHFGPSARRSLVAATRVVIPTAQTPAGPSLPLKIPPSAQAPHILEESVVMHVFTSSSVLSVAYSNVAAISSSRCGREGRGSGLAAQNGRRCARCAQSEGCAVQVQSAARGR
jgi:hypothetical protein